MRTEHAAGGVVFRATAAGIELLMILDRFGKLTLPKGKLEAGETAREAALREIKEETGVQARILTELLSVNYSYTDAQGCAVDKQADYFLLQAETEEINPQLTEIITAEWVPLREAIERCGYENNLQVLAKAKEIIQGTK